MTTPPQTKIFSAGEAHPLKSSISKKSLILVILIFLFLIPLTMVQWTVTDRSQTNNNTTEEISQSWGGRQKLNGPFLGIPCEIDKISQEGQIITQSKTFFILPEKLDINAKVTPQNKYRGLYNATVYNADLFLTGHFKAPSLQELEKRLPEGMRLQEKKIHWDKAYLTMGLRNLKGLRKNLSLLWNREKVDFLPGLKRESKLLSTGVHAPAVLPHDMHGVKIPFSVTLPLRGGLSLEFTPVGRQTTISMASPWKDPSFHGSFLPDEKHISNSGFTSKWDIPYYSRNYDQILFSPGDDLSYNINSSAFGVEFLQPVDPYKMGERTLKYGFLLVIYTFTVLFATELLSGIKLHPFQYGLLGISQVLFFLITTALAEQIGFGWAYLLGTVAILVQVTCYILCSLQTPSKVLYFGGAIGVLYAYIYVILSLENNAFLVGSVGLFVILSAIMFSLRKVKWYEGNDEQL